MTEIHYESATRLISLLDAREIGARELLDHFLDRVERHNPSINALIWQDVERARVEADASDRRRAAGETIGPLDGLPVTVKESFDLAGAPTTWGDPEYLDNVAGTDSAVVEKYRAAGAVVFGKTNVPFMLGDWQSFNAIYGTCGNPWDLTRTPGGSSGGSAAALAAGLTGLETGSDIGASIRNPAHYCGVFGHKPTWDVVSGRGQALPGDHAPPPTSPSSAPWPGRRRTWSWPSTCSPVRTAPTRGAGGSPCRGRAGSACGTTAWASC